MPEDFSSGCVDCQLNSLASMVDFLPGQIVSKTLLQNEETSVTLFALDQDQAISEHTSPGRAIITCMQGTGIVTINGEEHILHNGDKVEIPPEAPHSLYAKTKYKMLLEVVF